MTTINLCKERYFKELKQYYNNNVNKLNMREMFESNEKRFKMFR